jgi:F0F1-type ATP synthase alpha subunit
LNRGEKLTELLKQPQFKPMPVEEQVVVVYAGVRGYLDKILTSEVNKFETLFLEHMRSRHSDLLATIKKEGHLS